MCVNITFFAIHLEQIQPYVIKGEKNYSVWCSCCFLFVRVCVYFFPSAHRWLFIFIHCTHSPAIEIQLLNHVQKKHKVLRQTLHVIWLNSVYQTLHTDTIHKSWWDLTNKNEQKWKLFRIIITIKEMLHIFLCRRCCCRYLVSLVTTMLLFCFGLSSLCDVQNFWFYRRNRK